MNLDGVVMTIDDLHPYHCAWGIHRWFHEHGLDFRDFLDNGIPAKQLYDTGDAFAIRLVERKVNGRQE